MKRTAIWLALALGLTGARAQAANFQVYNNEVWGFPIQCVNETTLVVGSCPAGTTFSAVSSLPASLGVALSGGTVYLTPLVRVSPGLSVTVNGTGLVPQTFVVDIVSNPSQLGVSLNTSGVVTTPQNIPTAPGP